MRVEAQHTLTIHVMDSRTKESIPDVSLKTKDNKYGSTTDSVGLVIIKDIKPGTYTLLLSVVGYESRYQTLRVPDISSMEVFLEQSEKMLSEILISSTRDDSRLEDAPLKMEVVDKTEMQEEQATRPANVTGLLGDISGVKVQQTSAVSGNANLRMQGLDGRYTQILYDGIPLYDGLSGGFGILQVAPLDLKQIELIKGSASTLYGGGAIGGLINFIPKKPSTTQEGVLILNQTTLSETNAHFFGSKKYNHWGYTLFGGYTHQNARDVNKDGFSDLPKLQTFTIHPKLFYYPSEKTILSLGYSGIFEQRSGGDMLVLSGNPDNTHQFFETNKTERNTGEFRVEQKFHRGIKGTIKASLSNFNENIQTSKHFFNGSQLNYFSEASLFIPHEKYDWVIGINITGNSFKKKPSDPIFLENITNNTAGLFSQFTFRIQQRTILQAGARIDHHNNYGTFVLPGIAFIHHFNNAFALRAGFGIGYKTPNALDQLTIDYPIEQLHPVSDSLGPEYSYGFNVELNYKKQWETRRKLFINSAFFHTTITSPVIATEFPIDNIYFSNASKPITAYGIDLYMKLTMDDLEVYAGYTHTIATRKYLITNQPVPLIPKDHFSLTGTYEIEGKWRFGAEFDYVGSQYRDGDSRTPDFAIFSAILEKDFGNRYALLFNAENIFDYRQSGYENLYRGTIIHPDFKPLWAPIDGRAFSFSFRYRL